MIAEAHGIPLAVSLSGGQRNDVTQLMPLIAAIPPVRGRRSLPRRRPGRSTPTGAMTNDKYRRQVREKGITPVIARPGTEHGSGLGVHRWWLSSRSRCCTGSGGCASAGRSATTSTRHSSAWPAALSAGVA